MTSSVAHVVYVPIVEESEATGAVAEMYEEVRQFVGAPIVPHIFKVLSSQPALLKSLVASFSATFSGAVPRPTKEIIAAWVSRLNDCTYLVSAHSFFLRRFGAPAELIEAIANAPSPAGLPVDEKTRAAIVFAEKITKTPHDVDKSDWDALAAIGWTIDESLEIAYEAALFNFTARLVDASGLGTADVTTVFAALANLPGAARPAAVSSD
jgi:uncharacterized peroxidase-related enzyme